MSSEEDGILRQERRNAELEFISAAFAPDEAWFETTNTRSIRIHRRLLYDESVNDRVSYMLQLELPEAYPDCALDVASVQVQADDSSPAVVKVAHNAASQLKDACREVAGQATGNEAIFSVFAAAQEWLQDVWPSLLNHTSDTNNNGIETEQAETSDPAVTSKLSNAQVLIERRFIYSHHIISKVKRADIMSLAKSQLHLTGYMKIGWPGILLVEGRAEDCQAFYDIIRRWQWQFLVERGRDQREAENETFDSQRVFEAFVETNDMSTVAQHCQSAGLDGLFRSSMKLPNAADNTETTDELEGDQLYGALIHVDHMNDGKAYRKWLRKTCDQRSVGLMIKYCSQGVELPSRPIILVALVGDQSDVCNVLKRWRTSKVDVDCRNKPCLERMMTILAESKLESRRSLNRLDWEQMNAEAQLQADTSEVIGIVESIGGSAWQEQVDGLLRP